MRSSLRYAFALGLGVGACWLAFPRFSKPVMHSSENLAYLPKAEHVRWLALGHTESLASLFWISELTSYGESLITGQKTRWLAQVADITTTLDPHLYRVYSFLGSAPGIDPQDPKVIQVLERGVEMLPGDWRLALYYSLALVEGHKGYDKASQVMSAFANTDTVPPYVNRIYRTFAAKGKPSQEALLMYLEDYCNPQYAPFALGLEKKIAELLQVVTNSKQDDELRQLLRRFQKNEEQRSQLFAQIAAGLPK